MESILKNRITEQARHGQLGKNQRGFNEGKSRLPDLSEIHKDVGKHTDKEHPEEVMSLEFKKKFEKVKLLSCLRNKVTRDKKKPLETEGQEAKGST